MGISPSSCTIDANSSNASLSCTNDTHFNDNASERDTSDDVVLSCVMGLILCIVMMLVIAKSCQRSYKRRTSISPSGNNTTAASNTRPQMRWLEIDMEVHGNDGQNNRTITLAAAPCAVNIDGRAVRSIAVIDTTSAITANGRVAAWAQFDVRMSRDNEQNSETTLTVVPCSMTINGSVVQGAIVADTNNGVA